MDNLFNENQVLAEANDFPELQIAPVAATVVYGVVSGIISSVVTSCTTGE